MPVRRDADGNIIEEKTRIGETFQQITPTIPGQSSAGASAMDDPPVGWLVVVRGPGQGNFVAIGNGSNSVGRDEDDRIRIDFGYETISRRGHSTITYDPRGKKFYLQHGSGKNLTYLEGSPVLAPTELAGFPKITIGNTELLFVPLCCEQFDWEEYT